MKSKCKSISQFNSSFSPYLNIRNVPLASQWPRTVKCIPADIDECATATHNCNGVAHCYNNNGSFTCKCRTGYHGDGLSCKPLGKWTFIPIYIKRMRHTIIYA